MLYEDVDQEDVGYRAPVNSIIFAQYVRRSMVKLYQTFDQKKVILH